MKYPNLVNFIEKRMRMSHIYQPVMIQTLLQNDGRCSIKHIAKAILVNDQSQIEYYEKITTGMVGRILKSHGIVEKQRDYYLLTDYDDLNGDQVNLLVNLCQQKLNEYIDKRGKLIWEHRKVSREPVPGSVKYDVLKRAKFHCELCGISANIRSLEVDHVIPRNKGGSDDPDNLQALCYSCNSMKRDKDDTDFRKVKESYDYREKDCIFCKKSKTRTVDQNELAYAVRDKFPVTPLHTLIIPKRHVSNYFELSRPEINACNNLVEELRYEIEKSDPLVSGFNVGVNIGETAGQTIPHCHMHLIPRRKGDVEDPHGGLRHLIPEKGYYKL